MKKIYKTPYAECLGLIATDIITVSLGQLFDGISGVDDAYASGKDLFDGNQINQ